MISERQKAFRQEYRSRIIGWYDGYIHILIIYAMGAAAKNPSVVSPQYAAAESAKSSLLLK